MPKVAKKKTRPPKLSGFQRRKLQREQAVVSPPDDSDLRRVRVGRLETVNEWRREIGKVYREMRFAVIRTEIGTRLVYVAEIGARLSKMQEELESIEALKKQLEQMQGGQPLPYQELLPANAESQGDDE